METKKTACGRRIVPQPQTWRDIPRIVPFGATYAGTQQGVQRIANTAKVPLHITGLAIRIDPGVSFRIHWPDGFFLSQTPLMPIVTDGPVVGPLGAAGNMLAFNEPVIVQPGQRIAIENSGAAGSIALQFWGFLRYPDSSPEISKAKQLEASNGVETTCLIGYPSADGQCLIGYPSNRRRPQDSATAAAAALMSNRYQCNGNILAPEFRLGNQCNTYTPDGYRDESFTFFSDPITVAPGALSANNVLIVPGLSGAWTIAKRWRVLAQWVPSGGGNGDGVPTVGIRTPEGISLTGGDQIPVLPWSWIPFFPFQDLRAGGRLVLDVGTFLASGATSAIIVTVEFDAVKRTRLS